MPHPFRLTVRTGAAALLVGVSLVACRSEPARKGSRSVFRRPANPVKVIVTRDSGHAARALVPIAGGTISAVGGDGSRFTLTVPPNALPTDTTVTVTPVSSIAGLPLSGGLVAAVHLEPEGLHFNAPVVLRIEPARAVPPAQQMGFGYLGTGDDFHLYPLDRGGTLGMRLLHFSGAGVAAGTQADASALGQRTPASSEAQLEQKVWELLEAEHQAQLLGEPADPEFTSKLAALLNDYYENVVLPKLDAATKTDDWRVMFDAVQTATFFARMSNMIGEDASALAKLLPLMEPILVRGFDRAYFRCILKLGGDREAGLLMIIARNAALTLFGVSPDDPRFPQSKIQECFAGGAMLPKHLELSFEAAITFQVDGDGNQVLMTAGSTMRLEQTPGSTTYYVQGWAPIAYRDFRTIAGPGCPSYTNLKAHDGEGNIDLFVHPDGHIGAMNLSIEFEKGPWEEWTRVECDGTGHPGKDIMWSRALNQLENVLTRENPPGYVGVPTGMTLTPRDPILSSTIERTNYSPFYKKGVIKYGLKVLP
jgi:hypothetical protein